MAQTSSGTGVVVNDDGWIITNYHVVESCRRIVVEEDSSGVLVDHDSELDAALVKVKPSDDASAASIRLSPPRLGEDVVALGFPLSQLLSSSVKATTGNVNALAGPQDDNRFLQHSAPLQPGNSGGALTDRFGRIIGINTFVLGKSFSDESGFIPQNVNFALKIGQFVPMLKENGVRLRVDTLDEDEPIDTETAVTRISKSVVSIHCFEEPPSPALDDAGPAGEQPILPNTVSKSLRFADGYDIIGFDFLQFADASVASCEDACLLEQRCVALTYNKRERYCFLKDDALLLVRNDSAISAYAPAKAQDTILSNLTVVSDYDSIGGDYAKIDNTQFVPCLVACIQEDRCRAFAYVRKRNQCWLKDELSQLEKQPGVEFGYK